MASLKGSKDDKSISLKPKNRKEQSYKSEPDVSLLKDVKVIEIAP